MGGGVTAVYDCVVLLQAAGNPGGPAGACLDRAEGGAVRLVASPDTLTELTGVLARPKVRRAFPRLTDVTVAEFLARLGRVAALLPIVPAVVRLARDPNDEMYLNLAVAADADALVTWDNDILALMTGTDPDAVAFRGAHPAITALTPPAFLDLLAHTP